MAENDIFEKIEKIKMPIRILILVGTVVVIGVVVFFFIYKPYLYYNIPISYSSKSFN